MYILKNALKCIGRSKGRNILIGIIVLVIAISCCLGLSIRQAAESAKEDTLEGMTVTATISFDRSAMMNQMMGGERGGFDRNSFAEMMGGASSLTLEEYETYATADSVQEFYYSLTSYVNGSDAFLPVSTDTEEETDGEGSGEIENMVPGGRDYPQNMPGGMGGGMMGAMGINSDFSLIGYSSESAMTSFINGSASITEGTVFEENTADYTCIISEELATFNDLAVGDTVEITNPNDETEAYTLTIVGLYTDTSANENSFSRFGATASDPANRIYMSSTALQAILDTSTATAENRAVTGTLAGTYVFADVENYEKFEEEARALGLSDSYTVSSSDVSAYETSLTPLNTLSTMAGYFLIVVLVIGAIILIVLNIFNVRERKYEIGVLTAIGMKKGKVALQFLTEIFIVTLTAILIGVAVGAVSSVPVTNALLENQISSQETQAAQMEQNFGRGDMGGNRTPPNMSGEAPRGNMPEGGRGGSISNFFTGIAENTYITEIRSAMNFTVVWQMLGIGILLTLAAGTVSMLFVMRYEPLKILANRD